MEREIWKDIEGYEGLYQVSNMGRVKSLERTIHVGKGHKTVRVVKEKILKFKNKTGHYYQVCLSDVDPKYISVHRLVAKTFLDNPNGYEQVNHKNENKKDNRVENLEWCSQSYNVRYNGLNIRSAANRSKPVLQTTKEGKVVCIWQSANEAGRALGIYQGNISACCNGRIKSTGGYSFQYISREIERVSK